MRLVTWVTLTGHVALGLADLFLWIQVVRASREKRRRFLWPALFFLLLWVSLALSDANHFWGI